MKGKTVARGRKAAVPTSAVAPAGLPDWFDPAKHELAENGVRERSTGFYLRSDGLPWSGPARAARRAGETLLGGKKTARLAVATETTAATASGGEATPATAGGDEGSKTDA